MDLDNILNKYGPDFATTDTASESGPLPPGEYVATIAKGEWVQSRSGKETFRLRFVVDDGEYARRSFFHSLYFTSNAIAYSKRDLAKLGFTSLDQLPTFPANTLRVKAKLSVRTSDGGSKFNRVESFELIEPRKPTVDPFAPKEGGA